MTRDVPPERLPKPDVAGSNPVGRSKIPGGYGTACSPLGASCRQMGTIRGAMLRKKRKADHGSRAVPGADANGDHTRAGPTDRRLLLAPNRPGRQDPGCAGLGRNHGQEAGDLFGTTHPSRKPGSVI